MFVLDRQPSLAEKLGSGLGEGLGAGLNSTVQALIGKRQESKENEALKRLTGKDFSGLSPETRREFLKLYTGAHSQRAQEKQKMLETGLGTIAEMRNLLGSAGGWSSNPLNKIKGLFPTEVQKERTQLEQLGKSLIPLVSAGVSIRNQKEFDEYKKVITDPSSSPTQLEGALDGLENLMSRQIEQPEFEIEEKIEERPVFDISNPGHKKTREALLKKFKGDRKKVAKELSRHFREE